MAKKNPSYNEAMAEIEEIIMELESGTLDVDKLSEKVGMVSKLLKLCKEKLYKTEQEVENILKEIDNE